MKNFVDKLIKFLQTVLDFLMFWKKKNDETDKKQENKETEATDATKLVDNSEKVNVEVETKPSTETDNSVEKPQA